MSLNAGVAAEIQKLNPSAVIELFELDSTKLGGEVFRFHSGTNNLQQDLVWQGNTYIRFPIEVTGFEITGQGQFPRPTVKVSNVLSAMTTLLLEYGDLLTAKFTRKRTLLKFLDAVNFPGGVNPDADPNVFMPDDIYYVDRKAMEDRDMVQFELASAIDLQGVQVPKRTVIQSTCPWVYRGADCGYTGVALFDEKDQELPMPTSPEAIAMREAYNFIFLAQEDLRVAQQNLVTKTAAYEAAQQYQTETRYNYSGVGLKHYITISTLGVAAFWNSTPVPYGTEYVAGALMQIIARQGLSPEVRIYQIVRYTRNEVALVAAFLQYSNAVNGRNSAQEALDQANVDFETAMAAVPPDDPVFKQDRCGKRLTSCRIRFDSITPGNPLRFGGFPGVAR